MKESFSHVKIMKGKQQMIDGKVPAVRSNSIMKLLFLSFTTATQRTPEIIHNSMTNIDPKRFFYSQSACVCSKAPQRERPWTVKINGGV